MSSYRVEQGLSLNLSQTTFAVIRIVAEKYDSVKYCKILSSSLIMGEVREFICEVGTPKGVFNVTIWMDKDDQTIRLVWETKKDEQPRFVPTRIQYESPKSLRYHVDSNAATCEALSNGMRFAFKSDRHCQLTDEGEGTVESYYSFIVLEDGTYIPFPVFADACDLQYLDKVGVLDGRHVVEDGIERFIINYHEVTSIEMARYLRGIFGEQFMGWINDPLTSDRYVHTGEFIDGMPVMAV